MADEFNPGADSNKQTDNLLSLNLVIGDAIQLQDATASSQRYYVKLIGFLNKAGVIVSHPLKDGALLPLEFGERFVVRGFSDRKTYAFNASVLSSSTVPFPHLHLTFPDKVDCMTMPGALRIKPRSLAGWIEPAGNASDIARLKMAIVDMSTSGVRVHAEQQFGKVGDEIRIMFCLTVDDEEQAFLLPAVIRQTYNETLPGDAGNAKVMTHGLEFVRPEGKVRMALQGYICKIIAEG